MRYRNRKIKDSIGVDILDNIIEYVLDRKDEYVDEDGDVDEDQLDDIIVEEMDSHLIYDEDMWDVMKHYQFPAGANWDEAYMNALDDITSEVRDELGI